MNDLTDKELLGLWNMVFNLSKHMLHNEALAEEATQSIFERVITNYHSFKKQSKLSTWVYRIACNYLIDEMRVKKSEPISFDIFENDITDFKPYENELGLTPAEEKVYIEEIKIGCTIALLQCLSAQDRFVYIIGSIFNFSHRDSAEICGLSYDNYRKKLSRTKDKIRKFVMKSCGLINPDAECQCRKRILIATERGRINPDKLLYKTSDPTIWNYIDELNEIDEIAQIYQSNPFYESNISCIKQKFSILQEI